jgi:hypothetical protein
LTDQKDKARIAKEAVDEVIKYYQDEILFEIRKLLAERLPEAEVRPLINERERIKVLSDGPPPVTPEHNDWNMWHMEIAARLVDVTWRVS